MSIKFQILPGYPMPTFRYNNYTIDLVELDGNGVCNCTDFQVRCMRNIRNTSLYALDQEILKVYKVDYGNRAKPNPDRTMCKHIKFIRWVWLNHTLEQLAKQQKEQ